MLFLGKWSCHLVEVHQHFGEIYCLPFWNWRRKQYSPLKCQSISNVDYMVSYSRRQYCSNNDRITNSTINKFYKMQVEVPVLQVGCGSLFLNPLPVGYFTMLSVLRLYCIGWQGYRRIGRNWSWPKKGTIPEYACTDWGKPWKSCQDSWCSGQNLNQAPS